ncbi:MAG: helix-turn-helix domain-containing protein, partial [Lachnospiraceae bacterium]|nr:helix-turn-helix domain-containing protein [Lachnospiraceae bacterium]
MSEFSDRFRLLKDESGATLKELSEQLGITVPNLSYYMKGREPSYDILIKIADYFNVTTDWLIGRTDTRTPESLDMVKIIEKNTGQLFDTKLSDAALKN